jgi:hypothetical protein
MVILLKAQGAAQTIEDICVLVHQQQSNIKRWIPPPEDYLKKIWVPKKYVGADLSVNQCDVYQQLCSLWKRGRPEAESWTVYDLAQRLGFLPTSRTVRAW